MMTMSDVLIVFAVFVLLPFLALLWRVSRER